MAALDTDFTLFCPAFPEAGRTIYKGHLFVGDVLLSESGMRDHPLTPMRDPSLVRVLQRQSRGKVGLVEEAIVARGALAIRDAFARLKRDRIAHAVVDAIEDRDLEAIGEAAADFRLITGGSGIALGLPENFRRRGLLGDAAAADALPAVAGAAAVLSGSCSTATQAQVAYMRERAPAGVHDRPDRGGGSRHRRQDARLGKAPARLRADPDFGNRTARQGRGGASPARPRTRPPNLEETLAETARGLVSRRSRRLVVAGGETRRCGGAGVGCDRTAHRSPDRSRVPWTVSLPATPSEPALALALKSGNFGAPDFFLRAFDVLDEGTRA